MERSSLTLFINNGWYLPAVSGGDVHVMAVAARWGRVRDVAIAMPGWAYRRHRERLDGVRLIETTGRFEGSPPWPFAGVCLRWALRTVTFPRVKPALVVAASQYPYDLIPGLVLARRNGCPLVVYVFHLPSLLRRKGRGGRLVAAWEPIALRLLRHASLVLVDNHDVRRELVLRGIASKRIECTVNGTLSPGPTIAEPRQADEVVYCGRITESKGWQDLIFIGQRLRKERPGAVLRVLGEGERKKHLQRAITEGGLEDVIRTEGFVDEDTKWRALQRAAAFISPSREEGWGIAVAEAVEAGAEVVCYDLPVYREVHGDQRLHLVPVGDVETLGTRLVQVLSGQQLSPSLIARRSGGGGGASHGDRALRTWDDIASHELRSVEGLTNNGWVGTENREVGGYDV
jgi:glycosyltransferase involved in cell wall biosynthesis